MLEPQPSVSLVLMTYDAAGGIRSNKERLSNKFDATTDRRARADISKAQSKIQEASEIDAELKGDGKKVNASEKDFTDADKLRMQADQDYTKVKAEKLTNKFVKLLNPSQLKRSSDDPKQARHHCKELHAVVTDQDFSSMLSAFGTVYDARNTTKATAEQMKNIFLTKKGEQQTKERRSIGLKREAVTLEQKADDRVAYSATADLPSGQDSESATLTFSSQEDSQEDLSPGWGGGGGGGYGGGGGGRDDDDDDSDGGGGGGGGISDVFMEESNRGGGGALHRTRSATLRVAQAAVDKPAAAAGSKRKSLTPPPRGNVAKSQKIDLGATTQDEVDKFFG
jgi:hypothetical protein